jgi:hypothetical protein
MEMNIILERKVERGSVAWVPSRETSQQIEIDDFGDEIELELNLGNCNTLGATLGGEGTCLNDFAWGPHITLSAA